MGLTPAINGFAAETGNVGGVSSFLSVIGNSYDVKTMDSDTMGLVLSLAAELDIDFDASIYEEEYENFAIANVNSYLNVRSEANTDSGIVGHMYNGSVCEILDRTEADDGMWFKVVSGNVEGYARSDLFIYGDEALEVIEDYVKKVAVVQCNLLNVRAEANTDATVIGSAKVGDKLEVSEDEDIRAERLSRAKDVDENGDAEEIESIEDIETPGAQGASTADKADSSVSSGAETASESASEDSGEAASGTASEDQTEEEKLLEWVKVNYTKDTVGYVCLDYVVIQESYVTAKTIEEERAEAEAKRKAEEERRAAAAQQAIVEDTTIAAPNTTYSTNSELRSNIVEYAKQFVGTRYIMGGQSLTGGTDCSGFTCYVLANFGYSVGRTPSSQYSSAGRSVSLEEIQPGDIICYGSGGCSHVALYIGDGQIVHEANSRMGCCISSINFMNIVGIKNVID
ncbi:MAG: SH3 domain-containing protein [Lachnospiraceae bacterium]|nr:SH3 domain-containing protein [Lachnospiraceae bacterium]